tara:strand:+ start:223 stop:528 length:306 start_codon:yes stop_codon:yes gene_type:complete
MAIIKDGSRNVELTGKDKEEYIKYRFPEYDEDEIVTSREQELTMRIVWLEKGMDRISRYCNHNKKLPYINSRAHNHFSEIENEITSILDGEPTTVDCYNEE